MAIEITGTEHPARERAGDPDSPLRGGPVMTTERVAVKGIYGNARNGKRQNINMLLIDDHVGIYGAGDNEIRGGDQRGIADPRLVPSFEMPSLRSGSSG